MNTKLLMTSSAVAMAAAGLVASFAPQELLAYLGVTGNPMLAVAVQVTGALYLGFAMLNWMTRDNVLGGIYGRPVVMANFLHFAVASLALLKALPALHASRAVWVAAAVDAIFAVLFGATLFGSPVKRGA